MTNKITLDSVASGYDLSKINANFQAIQAEFQTKVLYRDNPVGEPNKVVTDIDMDGKKILNLPNPTTAGEPVSKQFLEDEFGAGALVNATAAAASAAAALVSETNAALSEVNAAASEATASAAALSAVAAADSIIWNDVKFLAFVDSPYTVLAADRGKLLVVDATSGNVSVVLPEIATLSLTDPWVVGVKKSDNSANTVTINRSATDTIDGNTSVDCSVQGEGRIFVPDTDTAPDVWTTMIYGSIPDASITLAKLAASVAASLVPAGAVQAFAMNSSPTGWLQADGSVVSRTTYAALFAAIGTTYNTGGEAGTDFRLPDLRGYFVRGSGANVDGTTSGAFGAKQADAFEDHTHGGFYLRDVQQSGSVNVPAYNGFTPSVTGGSSTGGTETRPANIAMLYCIKY